MIKFVLTTDTHYGNAQKTHRWHEKFLVELAKEIKEKDIKVLIHTGDWTSDSQNQFRRTLKMFRRHIDIPIVCVRGNHDLWQRKPFRYPSRWQYGEMMRHHKEWFKEFNIHHLEDNPFIIDDVIVCGFDGWYYHANPPTNDLEQIHINDVEGCPIMPYLTNKAHKDLDKILMGDYSAYRKKIMVTHHAPFTEDPMYVQFCANFKYLEPIKERFDVLCVGHSHQYRNDVEDGCLILNAGAKYNALPQKIIFEV